MSTTMKMQTPKQLKELLCDLVRFESISLSEQEKLFPQQVKEQLLLIDYFQKHPELVELHPADIERQFLTALYKHPQARKTVVLLSHYDVVDVQEYGDLQSLAFSPIQLTKEITDQKDHFPEEVQRDIESGDYLFGRGTMDMKCGLVLQLSLLEKASTEQWPINLLLLTVPDEEVNSVGMRKAVPMLLEISKKHTLNYSLFLNSEPVFSQKPGDETCYAYTGSIGKIMPSALFCGKETHVGEPLSGINAAWMASIFTRKMEWNHKFAEVVQGQRTPLPTTLYQKDLKQAYSVQTPHRVATLYNVFIMERSAKEVMEIYLEVGREAVQEMKDQLKHVYDREGIKGQKTTFQLFTYENLIDYAKNKFGKTYVKKLIEEINHTKKWDDDRELSIKIADHLSSYCQELSPMVVLFFTPPYYPAVHSSNNNEVKKLIDHLRSFGSSKFSLQIKSIPFYNGISDLSYLSYKGSETEWETYERNTPVWESRYYIPFSEMAELDGPVMNIGPFGKDAHKKTERLNIRNAFKELPILLEELVKKHMNSTL